MRYEFWLNCQNSYLITNNSSFITHRSKNMLIRIVRMTFQEDKIEDFLIIFNRSKHLIRGFEGCQQLELLRDKNAHNVMLTYSNWLSEEHLNAYRDSELFKTTWAATKVLFSDKPVAFSSELVEVV
jgi:heme-degrading monooxygenase HmoA